MWHGGEGVIMGGSLVGVRESGDYESGCKRQ